MEGDEAGDEGRSFGHSYNKAYELDNKTADKLGDVAEAVGDFCYSQNGNVYMKAAKYVDAAYAYAQA